MNEWDIADQRAQRNHPDTPNLYRGARILSKLADWANANSDGWAYWPKPVRAADKLMTLLESDDYRQADCSPAALAAALRPIKSFLTRQGVDHGKVIVS